MRPLLTRRGGRRRVSYRTRPTSRRAVTNQRVTSWNSRLRRYVDGEVDTRVFHGAYGHRLGSRPRLSRDAERALRVSTHQEPPPLDQVRTAVSYTHLTLPTIYSV